MMPPDEIVRALLPIDVRVRPLALPLIVIVPPVVPKRTKSFVVVAVLSVVVETMPVLRVIVPPIVVIVFVPVVTVSSLPVVVVPVVVVSVPRVDVPT